MKKIQILILKIFKKLIDIGNIPMTLFHWELNNDSSILNEIVPEIDN